MQHVHPNARERLEAQIGPELTRQLLESLRSRPESAGGTAFRKVG
jgi:hypothetical protein